MYHDIYINLLSGLSCSLLEASSLSCHYIMYISCQVHLRIQLLEMASQFLRSTNLRAARPILVASKMESGTDLFVTNIVKDTVKPHSLISGLIMTLMSVLRSTMSKK